jgi:hypothetical protein
MILSSTHGRRTPYKPILRLGFSTTEIRQPTTIDVSDMGDGAKRNSLSAIHFVTIRSIKTKHKRTKQTNDDRHGAAGVAAGVPDVGRARPDSQESHSMQVSSAIRSSSFRAIHDETMLLFLVCLLHLSRVRREYDLDGHEDLQDAKMISDLLAITTGDRNRITT